MATPYLTYDQVSQPGYKGQFNYIAPPAAKINVNSFNDVPSLNKAVSAGLVSRVDGQKRLADLVKKNNPISNPYSAKSIAGSLVGAGNQTFVQPVKDAVEGTAKQVVKQAQYLSGPSNAQKGLPHGAEIIQNQQLAAKNPEYLKAIKGSGRSGSQAIILAQQMAAKGAKAPEIRAFLDKNTKALNKQTATGAENIVTLAGLNVGGEGAIAKGSAKLADKTLGKALGVARASVGRDASTHALIDAQRAQTALKQAKINSLTGKAAVDEAKTLRVPVQDSSTTARKNVGNVVVANANRSRVPVVGNSTVEGVGVRLPIRAGVKEVSTTSKIGVRTPVQMPDSAFNKELQALNRTHSQDTKQLKKILQIFPTNKAKTLAKSVDTEYQGKLDNLMQRYKNPELSSPTKPKLLEKSTTPAGKNTGGLQKPVKIPKQPRTLANTLTSIQDTPRGSVPVPRSALDKHIIEQPAETSTGPVTASTPETKAITVSTPKPAETAPKSVTAPTGDAKVAGSSLRTQTKAVEAGMKSEADNMGATYNPVSHKEEAAKAAQLVEENPTKARSIAMGARGDNASHEAAVYHAVANKALTEAKKTGDYSEVTALANSPRHTGVSEAAQKLGAEGYNTNPHDPISVMNDIAKTRETAVTKRAKTTVAKETSNISKEVKAAAPKVSRQDWHSFITELQCK